MLKGNKLELFGKEIELRSHYCALSGEEHQEIQEHYLNLSIRTKFCNARCPFCIYHSDAKKWNNGKYEEILQEISSKIDVGKFSFTGGEPTLYWDNFKQIVDTSNKYIGGAEWQITTDGFRWDQMWEDPVHEEFTYIQLSRHHYDDKMNDKAFGTKTPTTDDIKRHIDKQTHLHQVQIRCNLMKGYIDSPEEVFKMLDWVNEVGINDIGLVSLMPVNDFSEENYIYFHIKDLIGENFMFTRNQKRHLGGCECFNYVYMPEENFRYPIKVYHKNTFQPAIMSDIAEIVVFDGENLRVGFDGEILY